VNSNKEAVNQALAHSTTRVCYYEFTKVQSSTVDGRLELSTKPNQGWCEDDFRWDVGFAMKDERWMDIIYLLIY